MADTDFREVVIQDAKARSFRNFLWTHFSIPGMTVSEEVKLFATEFKISPRNETTPAFKVILKPLGTASKLGKMLSLGMDLLKGANKIASGVTDNVNEWLPWVDNILAFKKATPITLQVKVNFHMGEFGEWDAQKEVWDPIMNLITLFTPKTVDGSNIVPSMKTPTAYISDFLKAAGTQFVSMFKALDAADAAAEERGEDVNSVGGIQGVAQFTEAISTLAGKLMVNTINASSPNLVNIRFASGKAVFKHMQPISCNVTFTNKDYDENGYPAYGDISMEFRSFHPAVTKGITSSGITMGFSSGYGGTV